MQPIRWRAARSRRRSALICLASPTFVPTMTTGNVDHLGVQKMGFGHRSRANPARDGKRTRLSKETRPNIVFVLCDNTGWGDFSCYGGSTPTPRMDKFAGEGVRFTNYTVESQCTPTRSAILTGRQSVRSG